MVNYIVRKDFEIILFEVQDVKLEVNIKNEIVWLSLEQMAKLFKRDRTVILKHINNIFREQELLKLEVCAKFAHTSKHVSNLNSTQTRQLDFYNLDVINVVLFGMTTKEWKDNNFNLNANMIENNICQKDRLEKLN